MGPGTLKRVGGGPARALAAAAVAAVFALVFSGHSCSSTETSGRPDGGLVCQHGGAPCPAGMACENGNCVQTCRPGLDPACPAGQYCLGDASIDQVCAPTSPLLCGSLFDCPVPQGCLPVLCSAGETLADGGLSTCSLADPNDGCGPDAICLQLVSGGGSNIQCRGMPACGQNGSCPVGPYGAVCNVRADGGRLIEGKQRICLYGYCTGRVDCASSQHCVFDPDGSFGQCYSGFPGSPCNTSQDCLNDGGCAGADAGVWGACQ